MENNKPLKDLDHHKQDELCKTRPVYRQGRKLTAVKVYTISSESQHLFIYGVPSINLRTELKDLCMNYGELEKIHVTEGYKNELFTECYHVHYKRIQSARIAKRLLDNKSFYGGILHVCYAPEFETLDQTDAKLKQRNKDVMKRLNSGNFDFVAKNNFLKRKHNENETVQEELNTNLSKTCREIGPQLPENYFKNTTPSTYVDEKQGKPFISNKSKFLARQVIEKRIVFKKHKENT